MNNVFYRFDSKIQVDNIPIALFDQSTIKNEPMMFNCSWPYAYEQGGPITRAFLDRLWTLETLEKFDKNERNYVIDSRVHMSFKPGIFLCIPGFHHDDVPRTRSDGQPNYTNPEYHAQHCMMLVNGEIAPTEFAIGSDYFPEVMIGDRYYEKWHPIVESKISDGALESVKCPSNRLVFFDWQTWHRGVPTVKTGWRFFIRASWNTNRSNNLTNEIRQQVQVYLPVPNEGW